MGLINTLNFLISQPLTSFNKLKPFTNFLHWQFHARLVNQSLSAFLFLFVENTKIILRQCETSATGNIYAGLHEFVDMCLTIYRDRNLILYVVNTTGIKQLEHL